MVRRSPKQDHTDSETAAAAALLIDAVRELSSLTTLMAVAAVVKRAARRLAGADGATFVLREDGAGDVCWYMDEDAIAPLWKGRRFPMSACISGWSMLYRQQAIIPDIYADDRIPHDAYRPTFVRSLVMTPVRTLRPWAAIGVYWATSHVPTPLEAGWLQSLADSTAVAMENVRVLAQLAALESDAGAMPRALRAGGALPAIRMCAWTRRLDLDGEWVSVEEYLQRRFGLQVSHGICDEALAMLESRRSRAGVTVGRPDPAPLSHADAAARSNAGGPDLLLSS